MNMKSNKDAFDEMVKDLSEILHVDTIPPGQVTIRKCLEKIKSKEN